MILSLRYIRNVECRRLERVFVSSVPNELVDRLNLLRQEKLAGNTSKNRNEQIIAVVDKPFKYDCLTEKGASFTKKDLFEF